MTCAFTFKILLSFNRFWQTASLSDPPCRAGNLNQQGRDNDRPQWLSQWQHGWWSGRGLIFWEVCWQVVWNHEPQPNTLTISVTRWEWRILFRPSTPWYLPFTTKMKNGNKFFQVSRTCQALVSRCTWWNAHPSLLSAWSDPLTNFLIWSQSYLEAYSEPGFMFRDIRALFDFALQSACNIQTDFIKTLSKEYWEVCKTRQSR